jgi:hypothetical protein
MVLENSETPKTKVYKIFRDGYIAGRALGNPRYEFDITSEQSCIYCFENWKNKHIAEENMATDEQVVKAINDILKILQPIKDTYDKQVEEKMHNRICMTMDEPSVWLTKKEFDDLQHFRDTAIGLWCIDKNPNEVDIEWIRRNSFQLKEPKKCECGKILDTNNNQEVEAGMCQACLDNYQK